MESSGTASAPCHVEHAIRDVTCDGKNAWTNTNSLPPSHRTAPHRDIIAKLMDSQRTRRQMALSTCQATKLFILMAVISTGMPRAQMMRDKPSREPMLAAHQQVVSPTAATGSTIGPPKDAISTLRCREGLCLTIEHRRHRTQSASRLLPSPITGQHPLSSSRPGPWYLR